MVQDMPYLEQIIHEVLRFYPPALRLFYWNYRFQ